MSAPATVVPSRPETARVLADFARSVPGSDPRHAWHVHMLLGQMVRTAHDLQDRSLLRAAADALRHLSPVVAAEWWKGERLPLSSTDLEELAGEGLDALRTRRSTFDGWTYASGPLAVRQHRRSDLAEVVARLLSLPPLEPYGIPYYYRKAPRTPSHLGVHKLSLTASGTVPVVLLVMPLDRASLPGAQYLPPSAAEPVVGARGLGTAIAIVGSGVPYGVPATGDEPACRLELAYRPSRRELRWDDTRTEARGARHA